MNKRRKSKGEVAVVVVCAVVGFLVAIQLKSVKLNTAVDRHQRQPAGDPAEPLQRGAG